MNTESFEGEQVKRHTCVKGFVQGLTITSARVAPGRFVLVVQNGMGGSEGSSCPLTEPFVKPSFPKVYRLRFIPRWVFALFGH